MPEYKARFKPKIALKKAEAKGRGVFQSEECRNPCFLTDFLNTAVHNEDPT